MRLETRPQPKPQTRATDWVAPSRVRMTHRGRIVAIAGGVSFLAFLALAIPPLRAATTRAVGETVLFVLAPLTPDVSSFADKARPTKVLAKDGKTQIATLGASRMDVPLKDVSPDMRHAVLAAEDHGFYGHAGLDPIALVRAAGSTVLGRTQGGSTITQQLAKLNYVGRNRTIFRKAREAMYAAALERRYSKDELLERYLNQVSFGQGAYGIGEAAQRFFSTTPAKLDVAQSAMLAGKIRSPERLDPWKTPDDVVERRNQVLRSMRSAGWLGEDDSERAPLGVVARKDSVPAGDARHVVDLVRREALTLDALGSTREAREKHLESSGGYSIVTSIDPKAQKAATDAIREVLGAPGDPASAVVAVDPNDGGVRAYVAGLDPEQEFDIAGVGRRQPGSSFKPFVYLAALEQGIDPRTRFSSAAPAVVDCDGEDWPVRNASGETADGMISLDDGMVRSVNAVYARAVAEVGSSKVKEVAARAGIPSTALGRARCAVALGGLDKGVTPYELASAYATLAAGGRSAQAHAIERIVDRRGEVVHTADGKASKPFDGRHVAVLSGALERVVTQGTGRAAAIGRPVAGKTGTTNDYADAWFAGYVPQLATAVWVGHPEGSVSMEDVHGTRVSGGTFPARIFSSFMKDALKGVPVRDIDTLDPATLGLDRLQEEAPQDAPSMVVLDATPDAGSPTPAMTPVPATTPFPEPVESATAAPPRPTSRPTTRPPQTPVATSTPPPENTPQATSAPEHTPKPKDNTKPDDVTE